MLGFRAYKRDVLRFAAIAALAVSAGACSSLPTVPDWVDPTSWFGDDNTATTDNGQTPDLASIPDKPSASTPDDQKQVAESLASDRKDATYSADALRGGTEAAAPPPPNVAPSSVASDVLPGSASDQETRGHASAAAPAPAPAPVQTAQVDRSVSQAPTGTSMPGTLPAPSSSEMVASAEPPPAATPAPVAAAPEPAPEPAAAAPASQPMAAAQPAPTEPATSEPPPGAQPAVAPAPAPMPRVAAVQPSDSQLGFKPSSAPPLDPSVSQFVAPSIIQHYQETASQAGIYSSGLPVRVARAEPAHRNTRRAMGGPEHMSGAVVANLDALQQPAAPGASTPSVYANAQGLPPTAVVLFPGDTVSLNAEGRALVRTAVEKFKAGGEQGYIRVVGHSSSRTPNMSPERHEQVVFTKSQERANAVAQEIIREGVPAAKVLVEAVGDTQPIYYESMPKGEDGNRRAEIFLQS